MHLPGYAAVANASHNTYEFLSSGPKGTIKKVVLYMEVEPGIFNLGFGDWDEIEQAVKDDTRTNNADRDKVLATVASTVVDFMHYHPDAILFAEGETPAKTRLYQMGINTEWQEISRLFEVQGLGSEGWEPFQKEKNYKALTLRAK
jgi:hypothetical protein